MNLGRFYLVSAGTILLMLAAAVWGWLQVGPDASVPMHWNVNGVADGFASALVAFLVLPLVTLGIVGLMAVIPRIEPRRENLQRSADAYRTVAIAIVILMATIQLSVVLAGVGSDVPMALVIGLGMGAMFVVIGNVLTTVRSNFMFGVRTPWTLSSDRSWDRTHRLVGRLLVLTGLVIGILSLTGLMALVVIGMLVMLAISIGWGTYTSYREWQADPERRPVGGAS